MLNNIDDGPIHSKLHKVCCCDELCCTVACNCLFRPCRKAVSGNKVRWQKQGFDLDLVYLDKRIIVHAFPAMGIEHIYRNPRHEIRRFLDTYHKNNYMMYNFCCEPGRGYDPKFFGGRVERYPFKDHNTPPLETMTAFCNSAMRWLDEDPAHVVNMHCKAGKGRAGLMSCIFLIRSGVAQSAKEAMAIYDEKRVTNKKGLTVTSQRKFVIFYETLWRKYWKVSGNIGDVPGEPEGSNKWKVPVQPKLSLNGVELSNLEYKVKGIRIKVFKGTNMKPVLLYDSEKSIPKGGLCTPDDCSCIIDGNFKVLIEEKKGLLFTKWKKVFEFWHNTLFLQDVESIVNGKLTQLDFGVEHLDIKKKMAKKLGSKFAMRLRFGERRVKSVAATGGKSIEMMSIAKRQDSMTNKV